MCYKSIDNEAVFAKIEMSDEGSVNFLQNTMCVTRRIEAEVEFTKREKGY